MQQIQIYFINLTFFFIRLIVTENLFYFFLKTLLFLKEMWYNNKVILYIQYGG